MFLPAILVAIRSVVFALELPTDRPTDGPTDALLRLGHLPIIVPSFDWEHKKYTVASISLDTKCHRRDFKGYLLSVFLG